MEAARPTWYTAVPTMHQAILTRAGRNREVIARHPLRFIRSSSSSLPPQVIGELEATFNAPVIEAYGMTEAAHQMASAIRCRRARASPARVGIAAGPEVAIMDAAGNLLRPGATGEIVIRGDNVTAGYENNPKANAEAFTNGWFRTGDQGVHGRRRLPHASRVASRRSSIAAARRSRPREVDEVADGPPGRAAGGDLRRAARQARRGRRRGGRAARRRGSRPSAICATSSASAWPISRCRARSCFVTEIPKGATGKLQRIGLAQKLGLG